MTDPLGIVLGWLDLVATTLVAGGLVFAALVAAPGARGRRLLERAAAVLATVLVAELAANAWRMGQISGIGGAKLVRDVLEMRWTSLWIARVGGLTILAVALTRPRAATWPAALLAAAWLLLRSFQGHAGAHEVAAAVADWVHLAAASVWIGGLAQLAAAEHRSSSMIWRLRALATGAVLTLVASGVYGALFHVQSLHALAASAYGRVLVAKVAIALPLFALGAANHFRLAPQAIEGVENAERRLVRAVRMELVLGIVVLAMSALLGALPMPHF